MKNWEDDSKLYLTTRLPKGILEAHEHCTRNSNEIYISDLCGCFYCCAIFRSSEVDAFMGGNKPGEQSTAHCPKCGIDSVIGDSSGYPITPGFLVDMNCYWFGDGEFPIL